MSTPLRLLVGLPMTALLIAGCVALLRTGVYGWTLFVIMPMSLGGLASWFLRPTNGAQAASLGTLWVLLAACFLLIVRFEGFICILMTLPLTMPMGAFGGWLVYHAAFSKLKAKDITFLALLPPATLIWDAEAPPPVFEVRTAIEIAACPEQVWKQVVTFSELPEPTEWFFRAGIAYPKRARIEGTGPGAIRYCEFSTGPFVEPIEVWDEPHLLQFRVTENPPPMEEWSPYGEILPRHLRGYLVSRRGQFRLTTLTNGHTLLEGTTWYQHGLWPAEYWRWWSDAIIHRIHLRVLNHIRSLSEASCPTGRCSDGDAGDERLPDGH